MVRGMRTAADVVSCEHASNRIPARYRDLGLSARQLRAHIAWDPGAAVMARTVARRLHCPLHLGRWSRLLIDLNRSIGHEKLIAAESFGTVIPGNSRVSAADFAHRVRTYYAPYRDAATADVQRGLRGGGTCRHWSIHSFTPVVDGVVRDCDIGLLYDPRRPGERQLMHRLRPLLAAHGLRIRMNYPYSGRSDGFTTQLRTRLPARRYLAFEIETNQRLLGTPAAARRMGGIVAAAVAAAAGVPAGRQRGKNR
jgi:predicted N-formylglutamate amidohydrolase